MRRFILLFLLSFSLAFPAFSTTIIPFKNLSELYLASDEVVYVQAKNPYFTELNGWTYNDCDFTVLAAMKGVLAPDSVIMLRQYSYADQWGQFFISGDFVPKENYYYLIFLNATPDGGWRPMMLSYYVFEQAMFNQGGDDEFFLTPVQESQNIGLFPRPDGEVAEPLMAYKRDALLQMFQHLNTNPAQPWDASAIQTNVPANLAAVDRALPTGCDFDQGAGMSRWKNQTINMYYDVTNAPADAGERFSSTLTSLNAEYPGLDLVNAGTADFTPDCSDMNVAGTDFINFSNNSLSGQQSVLLLFEDPCNQLANLVNCAGTLGLGGGYFLSTSHTFKAESWKDAAWGYLFINNNVRPCLTATNYDRLLSHEMTHTLKMDHLDPVLYPGNNMNPTCCNPINTKDRECMNYVYSAALPVDLTAFGVKEKDHRVHIQWATAQELSNDYFSIEKSTDALQFDLLAKVDAAQTTAAASYEYIDAQPFPGLNYYRLLQHDLDGTVTILGMRALNYKGNTVRYVVAPNPVQDNSLVLMGGNVDLSFESLEILDPNGRVSLRQGNSQTAGSNRVELSVADLAPGVYWLRINEGETSEMVKFVRH